MRRTQEGFARSRFGILMIVLMSSMGGTSEAPAADYANSVKIPCGAFPLSKCDEPISALRAGFKKVLEQASQEAYDGKLFISGKADAEGKELPSTPFAERAICSLQALPLNQCFSEETKNRSDEPCGNLAKLHFVNPPQYAFSLPKTRGGKETAWASGVLLSTLQEVALRIDQEISENRLSIGANSACQGGARDLFLLTEKFKSSRALGVLQGCRDQGLVACTAQKYLDATFEMMKAGYLQIARCVLFEESLRGYRDYARSFFTRITREVVTPCVQRCGEDAVCLPQCYSTRVPGWMRDDLRLKFPLSAAACAGTQAGGVR